MHELSITRSVVAIVSERAAGQRVTRVRLEIGRLSAFCGIATLMLSAALCWAGAEGDFGLAAMVHTHNWPNNPDVVPWDGKANGEFLYRAIPCAGNAPMNNISSNLPTYNSLIPGSRSPASTRSHPFKFTVKDGKMTGSINLTVCKLAPGPTKDERPDAGRDRIYISFVADSSRRTAEETIFSGRFKITGGTGRYAKLTGEGMIQGYFMCFDPDGCGGGANKGNFRDMQYVLDGKFSDPAFK